MFNPMQSPNTGPAGKDFGKPDAYEDMTDIYKKTGIISIENRCCPRCGSGFIVTGSGDDILIRCSDLVECDYSEKP